MKSNQIDKLSNFAPVVRDFVLGDPTYEGLVTQSDADKIAAAIKILREDLGQSPEQLAQILDNSWSIYDRVKSPTIHEFLTPEWLGPMALELFPTTRKTLLEYWNPKKEHHSLILGSAIGTSKSTISIISNAYITANIWCKRNPKRFYNALSSTSFVQALISFNEKKIKQVLLQPMIQILKASPRFRAVKFEDQLEKRQREYPNEICWTTASKVGALQFYNDIHYPIASSPQNLLGLNMITATLSEISFFIDRGFSPEYIWRIFQDSKNRIVNRFGKHRLATTILDSSPNDLEFSPIDKYIFTGEAYKDKSNYIVTGPHWNFRPDHEIYEKWKKTGETFPVFRGDASEPPEMLYDDDAVARKDPLSIIHVPIDLKPFFIEELSKNVKDWAGWPAGNPDKLIREAKFIDRIFKPNLRNFYSYIHLPATDDPKHKLWNLVRDRFFVETSKGRYEFYRAPRAPRFLHVDSAETKDHAGIVMSHIEIDPVTGEYVCVHDFTIDIAPTPARISLDAIRLFPEDLRNLGRIDIQRLTTDQYQSSLTREYWARKGFEVERISPDSDIKIYLSYVAWINSGRIKSGKNITLKGNLRSLQEIRLPSGKKKIEHLVGKVVKDDGGNWETSIMGVNAKDLTDSASASFYMSMIHQKGVPRYEWIEPEVVEPDVPLDPDEDWSAPEKPLPKTPELGTLNEQFLNSVLERYNLKL